MKAIFAFVVALLACASAGDLVTSSARNSAKVCTSRDQALSGALRTVMTCIEYSDGRTTIVVYRDGKKHGAFMELRADGTVSLVGMNENGVENGPTTLFDGDGRLVATNELNNGQLHGRYAEYHSNGQMRRVGQYECGKRVGPWPYFSQAGQLLANDDYPSQSPQEVACEAKSPPPALH